jgi:hypothetical protein
MGNYREVVWLIGDGRSGTTWLSDLINWEKSYREMFEPFHPKFVRQMNGLLFNQYVRPDDAAHRLLPVASEVFCGRLRDDRVDQANRGLWYRGLLIKDVFASLFACWAARQFPNLKIVLLIRNPFAVALSKWKTKDWHWTTDPRDFLKQGSLADDYLRPFEDLIRAAGDDYIENQVLIWAILHYVLLLQFKPGELHVVFYEDLLRQPEQELTRLFRYLKPDCVDRMTEGALRVLPRPSRVAPKDKKVVGATWRIGAWKDELSAEQIERGAKILARFGLDRLDDADSRPLICR